MTGCKDRRREYQGSVVYSGEVWTLWESAVMISVCLYRCISAEVDGLYNSSRELARQRGCLTARHHMADASPIRTRYLGQQGLGVSYLGTPWTSVLGMSF